MKLQYLTSASIILKDKAIKKIMAKGKDLAEKSKKQAIEELKKSKSKKSKSKTKTKSRPEPNEPTAYSGNHNFGFGFDMFNPQQTAVKQSEKEVDWSKLYDFRNTESSKKKKKGNSSDMWDFRGFYQ